MKNLRFKSCLRCSYYKSVVRRKKIKRKRVSGFFFKALVSTVILHGMICVSMSYVLAWQEHTQIVEGVSSTIITEIVAPILIYGFTKTVENIFQKNRLAFSKPINDAENQFTESENSESEG